MAELKSQQPLTSSLVLLFVLSSRQMNRDDSEIWYLPVASPPRAPAISSLTISLASSALVRFSASPETPWISTFGTCSFLLQCLLYCGLARVNMGTICQSTSYLHDQDRRLRKVSTYSFAFWTFLAAFHSPRPSLQPAFLIIGLIRAFHYSLLFTLVRCADDFDPLPSG
jgi:hypothetical protein